jgi:hypothetical protein
MTTLTAQTISFAQIRSLRSEAIAASDGDRTAICDLALDGSVDVDDYTTLTRAGASRLRTMTRDEAYAECAQAINAARSVS